MPEPMSGEPIAIPSGVLTAVYSASAICGTCGATVTLDSSCPHLKLDVIDGQLMAYQNSGQTLIIRPDVASTDES